MVQFQMEGEELGFYSEEAGIEYALDAGFSIERFLGTKSPVAFRSDMDSEFALVLHDGRYYWERVK